MLPQFKPRTIRVHARALGLKNPFPLPRTRCGNPGPRMHKTEPSRESWIDAATGAAAAFGLRPSDVLGGKLGAKYAKARSIAWQAVLEAFPKVSVAGLARVSGYNHTSILSSIGTLKRNRERMQVACQSDQQFPSL